jgi:hypothetical protein
MFIFPIGLAASEKIKLHSLLLTLLGIVVGRVAQIGNLVDIDLAGQPQT